MMLGEWKSDANKCITVSPLDLLKNPMILIAVMGLGVMIGIPYLINSTMSTPLHSFPMPYTVALINGFFLRTVVNLEIKKEFEEQ